MPEINYKQKYQELKQKYANSVDTAFRLGYEQGAMDAQIQQMQEQQAADAAAAQAAAQGGMPGEGGAPGEGAPGEEQGQPGQPGQPQQGDPAAAGGPSELDQHISQLEGMLAKGELTEEDLSSLKKSFGALKEGIELRKSEMAIQGIAKALKKTPAKPFQISKSASANMNDSAKAAVTMQHNIVTGIMKEWESEEKSTGQGISAILAKEGLTK